MEDGVESKAFNMADYSKTDLARVQPKQSNESGSMSQQIPLTWYLWVNFEVGIHAQGESVASPGLLVEERRPVQSEAPVYASNPREPARPGEQPKALQA
jgi:hypothetical protein